MSIYDQIKHDIAQDYYINNYSNDGQRFVAWYLRNIYGLEPFDAKDCITDGSGDKQIDAVYISEQDETVYIIQGKFTRKAKTDSEPVKEIMAAWSQIKNLQRLQDNSNDKLSGKINDISSALDNDYDLCFELVITSTLTQPAEKEAKHFRQELSDSETLTASLVVVDEKTLKARYDASIHQNGPSISYDFPLEPGRYMDININDTRAVIAVIPLTECVNIPGIQDGSLFMKNVRQSLGKKVKVNQEIAQSLKKNPGEFFFLHNGITAICSLLEIDNNTLHVEGLSVVNGCQSLTTIFGSSETVKKSEEGYIIFRFYEITENDQTETISRSTNSQNTVKARDLRSNDKYVLALKKNYEQYYHDGQFITKRGEKAGDGKNKAHIIELGILGKMLITWHVQKPTETHLESDIFSTYFNLLFHRDYKPEDVQALNEIYIAIKEKWDSKNNNPLDLDEALFKQKAYAPYWHLFAVSLLLCNINKQSDVIPAPDAALRIFKEKEILDAVINLAGECTNDAFVDSMLAIQAEGKRPDPNNWIKSQKSIIALRSAIGKRLTPSNPKDKEYVSKLREKLKMSKRDFSPVWRLE